MTRMQRLGWMLASAAATAVVNAALFGSASALGWFDGVVAAQNGEPVTVGLVVGASIVGVVGLVLVRVVLARLRGAVAGRRSFLITAPAILVLSFGSPLAGLDGGGAGAVGTLLLTHIVTVVGGVVAAERLTKPTWGWGHEPYEDRPLHERPVAVITGVTGGIGGATALALARRGFAVVGVGRSVDAADALATAAASLPGSVEVHVADVSSMRAAGEVGRSIARTYGERIDVVVHAVGTLKRSSSVTEEGIDANIATSWLSRVQLQRQLDLPPGARVINVAAAESGATPRRLLGDLRAPDDLETGFAAHGQAQLANDLWTASLQRRGIAAFGYGPGSVETGIRREIPSAVQRVMRPLFWWSTRRPDETAADIVRLALDRNVPPSGGFASRTGLFEHNDHVLDRRRQADIEHLADALLDRAASPA